MTKINIIGAGPAGNYAAYLLVKRGFKVNVFEENTSPGIPVQCTGLLSFAVNDLFKVPNRLIKKSISVVNIVSPSGKIIDLSFDEPDIVIDRAAFDYYLYKQAQKAGAKYFLNSKYVTSYRKEDKIISKIKDYKTNKIISFSSDYLVGADGPKSSVATDYGMIGKRRVMYGVQARIKIKRKSSIDFYPSYECFAWCVSESEKVSRVGLVSYNPRSVSLLPFIKNVLKIKNPKIIDRQGGLIPIFNKKQVYQKDKVFLIGDAAGLVKATTGGGIIQGLTSAKILSETIETKDYTKALKKELLPDLKFHLLVRQTLDKFDLNDWEKLIEYCSDKKVKRTLGLYSRDYPLKFSLKLLLSKPEFLFFARKFF